MLPRRILRDQLCRFGGIVFQIGRLGVDIRVVAFGHRRDVGRGAMSHRVIVASVGFVKVAAPPATCPLHFTALDVHGNVEHITREPFLCRV